MSTTLRDALARLTVPVLKDLVSHLPGAETAGRKDELIERIVVGMLGPGLNAIWSGLDETQQAAVAETVYHPLNEYSEQRFRAKYQRVPSFQVAGAKSHGYSGDKSSALGLFIHYAPDERCYFVPADLGTRLKAIVPPPAPLGLKSSETLENDEGLMMRLTEREATQEVVVMLRTIEQARIQVSEKTALPGTATLRFLTEKLAGGDFYPWGEKKKQMGPGNRPDQGLCLADAVAGWGAGDPCGRSPRTQPRRCQGLERAAGRSAARALAEVADNHHV